MKKNNMPKRGLPPMTVLALSFLAVILIGATLLTLPQASTSGEGLTFIRALFTATSGTCVTGLTVVDAANDLTLLGQIVLLALIQIGALGLMTFTAFLFLLVGANISLKTRMLIAESQSGNSLQGLLRLIRYTVAITFVTELIGAASLSFTLVPLFGVGKGIWYSVFHSVSAFCNAGFDLFGNYASLTDYATNANINITLMLLIIFGGLGFSVYKNLYDVIFRKKKTNADGIPPRLTLHTKLVLITTAILIFGGAILILAFEYSNTTMEGFTLAEKIQASFFQSVTSRTAGFDSLSQNNLTAESKLLTCFLMLIGASPAGTGGGIKTTTLAVIVIMFLSTVRKKRNIEITAFGRNLSFDLVRRALSLLIVAIGFVTITTCAISLIERGGGTQLSLSSVLFEVVSAYSTTGLSTGITTSLSNPSLVFLILGMFIGRVGMLTIVLSLAEISGKERVDRQFPTEDIPIG